MKLFWVRFVSVLLAFLAIDAAPTFGTIAITTATASTGLAILGLAKIGTAFALAASRRGKREVNIISIIFFCLYRYELGNFLTFEIG
jgi:hypothetical protein